MAIQLKGTPVAEAMRRQQAAEVRVLMEKGILPTLGIIRLGEREDDIAYERGAVKRCESIGVRVKRMSLPEAATQEELLALISRVNRDDSIHGVLLFRPLPCQVSDQAVCNALDPRKDVDGITDASMAGVFIGRNTAFAPCTARACIRLLEHYGYDLTGKRVTVVGRSPVIGKPVSMLMLGRNATVTICHTRTDNLPEACYGADILIAAAGKAGMIGEEHLSPGQVVIDVGINFTHEGLMCGDVDPEAAERIAGAFTPVPGGVGAVTTSVLVQQILAAAWRWTVE